jgi:hypothetical protein
MVRLTRSNAKAGRQDTDPTKTAEPSAETSADLEGSNEPNAYAVGYGCPPLASRFKPGQSGNPKGRKKHSKNMRTIMKQVLNEDMQIREKGRIRRMPTFEALVRTTVHHAFRGDPKAMNSLLVLVRHCGYGSDHDEPAAELLSGSDLKAIIDDYFVRNTAENRTASETKQAKETSDTKPSAPPASRPKKPM